GLARLFAMGACVTWQVVPLHGFGKGEGLAEGEAQSFASDGVDTARSVSDQSNVARMDGAKRVHLRDGAAFAADKFRTGQTLCELRAISQHFVEGRVFGTSGHHHDTDLFASDRGYVGLGPVSPMKFDMSGPGAYSIMPPRRVSLGLARGRFQATPPPHSRATAVGADNPTRGYKFAGQLHSTFRDSGDGRAPQQLHATLFGTGDQPIVQNGTADADAQAL